jgi:hypothetical protein
MSNTAVGFMIIAAALFLLFIGPWFTIMAINTLFGLNIEIGIGTWFAAAWLNIIVTGTLFKHK